MPTPTERSEAVQSMQNDFNAFECIHVYPRFGKVHSTNTGCKCWCYPDAWIESTGVTVVHNIEQ